MSDDHTSSSFNDETPTSLFVEITQSARLLELPLEIISEIYRALARTHRPQRQVHGSKHIASKAPNLGWLYLTHACRLLRDIGIGMHALWAEDLSVLPRAFDVFLKRSRNAPLHIKVDTFGYEDHIAETAPRLLSQVDHLEYRVRPFLGSHQTNIFLQALRERPLPARIMLLDVSVSPTLSDDLPLDVGNKPFDAPALRSLNIRSQPVPFRAPNLQSLDLHSCTSFTPERLCIALRELPLLRHLTWSNCSSELWRAQLEDDDGPHLKPVHLPHLESLDVVDTSAGLLLLGSTLVHPRLRPTGTKPVCIGINHFPDRWPNIRSETIEVCAALQSRLPAYAPYSHALTIPFSFSFWKGCHVLLSDIWDPSAQSYHSFAHTIFASTWSGQDSHEWAVPLPTLIKGATSSIAFHISHLYILGRIPQPVRDRERYPGEPEDTMRDAFGALRNVRELYVSYEARGVFRVLRCQGSPDVPNGKDDHVIFPLLETIVVDNFDTSKHRGWGEGTTQVNYEGNYHIEKWQVGHLTAGWWADCCAMLESRALHGHKLRRLVLRGRTCHIAVYERYDREKRETKGHMEDIGSLNLSQWVDEVIDEHIIACGFRAR
ncbi:unnamed protein product [Peniophora sp. CBMAI 1063]|nr:unnamed protein product [Peniophora sp. CBMAI 1063]